MNPVLLNGIKIPVPFSGENQFHEVINYLKGQIDPGSALITSVKIDGSEIPNTEDHALGITPLSHFGLIEVFTSHPKEVADDTLQDLIEFSKILEDLSRDSAEHMNETEFPIYFDRLMDGIGTFTDAISGVKRILKLGLFNSIQALETELLASLREILKAKEKGEKELLSQLLNENLPRNFKNWRESGLPSLVRSRDS